MAEQKLSEEMIKHVWHTYLTTGDMPESLHAPLVARKFLHPFIKRLPQEPRCNICYVPFEGFGGNLSRAESTHILYEAYAPQGVPAEQVEAHLEKVETYVRLSSPQAIREQRRLLRA